MDKITVKGKAVEVTPDMDIILPFYYKRTGILGGSVNRIYRNASGDIRKMSIYIDTSTGLILMSEVDQTHIENEIEQITRPEFTKIFDLMLELLGDRVDSLEDERLSPISINGALQAIRD